MASSIASQNYLENGSSPESIYLPKQTAIDKIGGIFCHICNLTFGNKKEFDGHYSSHNTGDSNIVYTCVACKKQISGYPSFRGHCYLNHVVKHKFVCKHCNKPFSKQSILNGHIAAVHEFKCVFCDEKFTTKKELELHKIVHLKTGKEDPPYDCYVCGEVISSIDMCESHIDDHCQIMYPCPICSKVLPNKLEATNHLTKHFDQKVTTEITTSPNNSDDSSIDILGGIQCCHCDLLFKNRTEFDNHFLLEHEDKPIVYTCNICGKHYEKYLVFGNHCYDHISRDKFQCEQCDRSFPRLSLLVRHTDESHSSNGSCACDRCGAAFKAHHALYRHLRADHSLYCLPCSVPECGAVFESPKELVLHQKIHNSISDNWCRQCGLQFTNLAACEKHLDVHKRKQFSCPVCNREYREKYQLVKHVPQHFESVLHVCKVCGKAYSARHRLVQHAKTHSQLRAHRCHVCGKGFLRPHELQQHVNIHTGQRPHACPLCLRAFASRPNWAKHLTRVHALDKTLIRELSAKQSPQPSPDDDVRAIVEHIDALQEDMDAPAAPPATLVNVPVPETDVFYASVPDQSIGLDLDLDLDVDVGVGLDVGVGVGWAECGPELGAAPGLDEALPHIDPRLTLRDIF